MQHRLPQQRLHSASWAHGGEILEERLRDGFEQLHTHRVIEAVHAYRNGETPLPTKGPDPLQSHSQRKREFARQQANPPPLAAQRRLYPQLEALDQEVRDLAEKERKLLLSGKVLSRVHDRKTTTTLVLARTATRLPSLPKLDLPPVTDAKTVDELKGELAKARAHLGGPATDRPSARRAAAWKDERAAGEKRQRRQSGQEQAVGPRDQGQNGGAQTDRPRQKSSSPMAAIQIIRANAKASDQITQWKRDAKPKKVRLLDKDQIKPLPSLRATWKSRVRGACATMETTEWKGFVKFEKLRQKWEEDEQAFRTLLESCRPHARPASPAGAADNPEDDSSFFLTGAPFKDPPVPSLGTASRARLDEADAGQGIDHEEEEEEEGNTRTQLFVDAPAIGSLDDDDDDDDEDVVSKSMTEAKPTAHFDEEQSRGQDEEDEAALAAFVAAAAEEEAKMQKQEEEAAKKRSEGLIARVETNETIAETNHASKYWPDAETVQDAARDDAGVVQVTQEAGADSPPLGASCSSPRDQSQDTLALAGCVMVKAVGDEISAPVTREHPRQPSVISLQDIDQDGDGLVDEDELRAYAAQSKNTLIGAALVRVQGLMLNKPDVSHPYKSLNGDFHRSDQTCNGRAVYFKREDVPGCSVSAMWWANMKGHMAWCVGPSEHVGKAVVSAYVLSLGVSPDEAGDRAWNVFSYQSSSWEMQTGVLVMRLEPEQGEL